MSQLAQPENRSLIEGIARVVAIEGRYARFEPEQSGGCGACASAAVCNEKGIGTLANRLETRRFEMPNELALRVGDRVVLGLPAQSLLTASAAAYLIPLACSLSCAALAQWRFGGDGASLLGALGGLLAGFLILKLTGSRQAGEKVSYRILRLAQADEKCR